MKKQNTAIALIALSTLSISGYFVFKHKLTNHSNITTTTRNTTTKVNESYTSPELKETFENNATENPMTQNNSDNVDWTNYTNETAGYSINYPSDWTIDGLNPGSGTSEIVETSRGIVIKGPKVSINIEPELATGNYIDWAENLATNQYYTVETKTDELLGNTNALKLTGRSEEVGNTKLITNYLLSNIDSEYYISVIVISNAEIEEVEQDILKSTLDSFLIVG